MTGSLEQILQIAKSKQISLDEELLDTLLNHKNSHVNDPASSTSWQLLSADNEPHTGILCESLFGGKNTLTINVPSRIAEVLDENGIEETTGTPLPIAILKNMIAIGKCEGDYLLIDHLGRIWSYFHDGHSTNQLASSWNELAQSGNIQLRRAGQFLDNRLIGNWVPFFSQGRSIEFRPKISFNVEGTITRTFANGEVITSNAWCVGNRNLIISSSGHDLDYQYLIKYGELVLHETTDAYCRYRRP